MRHRERQIEEKRLCLVTFDESKCFRLEQILRVLLAGFAVVVFQFNALVVAVDVSRVVTVRVSLAVVAEEQIEAVLERAAGTVPHPQAPLSHRPRCVAFRFEQLRERHVLGADGVLPLWLHLTIVANRCVAGMFAGHEGTPRWRTHRTARIEMSEFRSAGGEFIDVWCLDLLLAVTAEFEAAEIVGHDEDDVRLVLFGTRGEREADQHGQTRNAAQHDNTSRSRVVSVALAVGVSTRNAPQKACLGLRSSDRNPRRNHHDIRLPRRLSLTRLQIHANTTTPTTMPAMMSRPPSGASLLSATGVSFFVRAVVAIGAGTFGSAFATWAANARTTASNAARRKVGREFIMWVPPSTLSV